VCWWSYAITLSDLGIGNSDKDEISISNMAEIDCREDSVTHKKSFHFTNRDCN
jgi:hypothetical protein